MNRALRAMLYLSCLFYHAGAADAASANREQLEAEYKRVQADLDRSERELAEQNERLRTKQHDVEYQDPEIVSIRERLIALEKQVIEAREQLKVRIALKPEIKAIEAERKAIFQTVRELRELKAAIERELAASGPQSD